MGLPEISRVTWQVRNPPSSSPHIFNWHRRFWWHYQWMLPLCRPICDPKTCCSKKGNHCKFFFRKRISLYFLISAKSRKMKIFRFKVAKWQGSKALSQNVWNVEGHTTGITRMYNIYCTAYIFIDSLSIHTLGNKHQLYVKQKHGRTTIYYHLTIAVFDPDWSPGGGGGGGGGSHYILGNG